MKLIRRMCRSIGARARAARVRNRCIVLLAVAFFFSTPPVVKAQLGPKDGTNLAATDLDRVKVGDPAPDFTLENIDGQRVTLSEVYRKRNVVLVFYRGQW
jgi:cytochrome oxidase Cu insertion factor (SCO1/SenC/PrrC family)